MGQTHPQLQRNATDIQNDSASETTCKRFVNKFLQKKNLIAKFD